MKLLYLVESGESKFLVFDEMPDKISTKYGDDTIIGRIGGIFYDFLAKRNERREAFGGGRKFDIVLDNGEIEKCEGQWWDAVTDRAREELEKEGNPFSKMMLIGVSSVDRLSDCYVYYGLWASESKIEEIVRRDVESCQSDWFIIDKEIFMQPENKNKAFILGTRKTGCDMIVLGGTNCSGSNMDWLFGCLGNENFYVCQPVSFYKSQQEIQKVNPLYAFKVATAYFREQGKVPVFEDSNCRLIKL